MSRRGVLNMTNIFRECYECLGRQGLSKLPEAVSILSYVVEYRYCENCFGAKSSVVRIERSWPILGISVY